MLIDDYLEKLAGSVATKEERIGAGIGSGIGGVSVALPLYRKLNKEALPQLKHMLEQKRFQGGGGHNFRKGIKRWYRKNALSYIIPLALTGAGLGMVLGMKGGELTSKIRSNRR